MAESHLKSRLQDALDALRADYPRSAEDLLRAIIDELPDETTIPLSKEETRQLLNAGQPEPMPNRAAAVERFAKRHDETPAEHPTARALRELADSHEAQGYNDMIAFTPTALRRFADQIDAVSAVKRSDG